MSLQYALIACPYKVILKCFIVSPMLLLFLICWMKNSGLQAKGFRETIHFLEHSCEKNNWIFLKICYSSLIQLVRCKRQMHIKNHYTFLPSLEKASQLDLCSSLFLLSKSFGLHCPWLF